MDFREPFQGKAWAMNCPACGADVVQSSVYCHRCGARLGGGTSNPGGSAAQPMDSANSESFPAPEAAPSSGQPLTASPSLMARGGEPPSLRPGGEEKEQELWQGGYSGKDMYEAWTLYALVSLVLIVISIAANTAWVWWASVVLILLLWVRGMLVLVYRKWSVAYRLTNRRFFHEKGILRRVTDRLELIDIDDITVEQSIIDRLVGVGTIKITSSDRTHPVLELPGIKDARHVADLMDNARLEERRRRGLHIEAI